LNTDLHIKQLLDTEIAPSSISISKSGRPSLVPINSMK
jgi:flagellar hook-length control protein FliK